MNTPVIHHIGLSVRDIDTSTDWYVRHLNLAVVASFDEPAPMRILMSPDGQAIDLRQDPEAAAEPFTQRNIGLDHVGFVVRSRAELDAWQQVLADAGIEHSGIVQSPFGWHLNFRDPDQIALEFFLPESAASG